MHFEDLLAEFDLSEFLKKLPASPGIYRMFDKSSDIIYVGKAKNLKKRVSSYFSGKAQDSKTIRLVKQIAYVEITITDSDYEAYILESNLIKKYKPKYNIVFKDDKAYPFLVVSGHKFPKVYGYRGKRNKSDTYYGPYVSLSSVKDTLALIQKIFNVRQCKDSYFNARTRPCLQYQIDRCSAPCVGYVKQEEYAAEVDELNLFLSGNLHEVLSSVAKKMEQASEQEQYELAMKYRDQLILLRKLQEQQYMNVESDKNHEVIGVYEGVKLIGISLLQISHGKILGERSWQIKIANKMDNAKKAIEQLFIDFYLQSDRSIWPHAIIVDQNYVPDIGLLELISQKSNTSIEWVVNPRGVRQKWLALAQKNAANQVAMKETFNDQYSAKIESLSQLLEVDNISRLECFDVSHLHGEQTVAACVVFDQQGSLRSEYRKYNIKGVTGGDDYAAIYQAVTRRVQSGIEKNNLPDILIIDGGKGQFKQAKNALVENSVLDKVKLVSLGKGPERKSGYEDIFIDSELPPLKLDESHLGFLLLREIRDESHRFSITAQRKRSLKKQNTSIIESIDGIGEKRAKALLLHFGGWQELEKASVEEIAKVDGVGKAFAGRIWESLH